MNDRHHSDHAAGADHEAPSASAKPPTGRRHRTTARAMRGLAAIAAALALVWLIALYARQPHDSANPFGLSPQNATQAGDALVFVALGDTGHGNAGQRSVAQAMSNLTASQPIDFALLLGDNFYDDGVRSVDDPLFQDCFEAVYNLPGLMVPFYAVAGNHDHRHSIQPQIDYSQVSSRWQMPAAWYSWSQEIGSGSSALFVAIDTQELQVDDPQWRWLDETLAHSDARWKFVFGHHPFVRSPDVEVGDRAQRFIQMLDDRDVDLYLCGHEHELVYFKRPGKTSEIISGVGSKARVVRDVDQTAYAGNSLGFACVRVEPDALRIALIDDAGNVLMRDVRAKQ